MSDRPRGRTYNTLDAPTYLLCCEEVLRYATRLPVQQLIVSPEQRCVYLLTLGEPREEGPLNPQGVFDSDCKALPERGRRAPQSKCKGHELVELRFYSDGRLQSAEVYNAHLCCSTGAASLSPSPSSPSVATTLGRQCSEDLTSNGATLHPRIEWTWATHGVLAWTCEDAAVRFYCARSGKVLLLHLVAEAGPLLLGDTACVLSVARGRSCCCPSLAGTAACTCNPEVELLVGCSTGRILSVRLKRLESNL